MDIRVVNIKTYKPKIQEILINIDRSTPLGNPYLLKSEKDWDSIINEFENYFKTKLFKNIKARKYFIDIVEMLKYNNVALGCWCKPKKCHGDIIMSNILKYIESKKVIK